MKFLHCSVVLGRCLNCTMAAVILIYWLWSHSMAVSLGEEVPEDVIDLDDPVYTLKLPNYMATQKIKKGKSRKRPVVIYSDYNVCYHERPIRYTFGSEQVIDLAHAIPLEWSNYLSVMSHIFTVPLYDLLKQGAIDQILMPFLFMVLMATIAMLAIIPYIIVGCIAWAIMFTFRIFGHKKVRMAIRSLLIRFEKYRRWKYERSFPQPHLRKFRERDRYQMPKAFQNSDLSSDDEPSELTREQIPRKTTTMWRKEEIALIGFDPDNIPMDTVYGDLLGNPERLNPHVRKYASAKSRKTRNKANGNWDRGQSVSSEQWVEAIQQKILERKKVEKEKSKGFFENLKHKLLQGGEGEKSVPNLETSTNSTAKQIPSKTSSTMSPDDTKLRPKRPADWKQKKPKNYGVVVQTIPKDFFFKPQNSKFENKSRPKFPSNPLKSYAKLKPPLNSTMMKPNTQSPTKPTKPTTLTVPKAMSTTTVQHNKQLNIKSQPAISPNRKKPVEKTKKKKSHFKEVKKKEPRRQWRLN